MNFREIRYESGDWFQLTMYKVSGGFCEYISEPNGSLRAENFKLADFVIVRNALSPTLY